MNIFFTIAALISFICFVVGIFCLAIDVEPFTLWVVMLICGTLFTMIFGAAAATAEREDDFDKNDMIQVEETTKSTINQYNYCPYCGRELNK